MDWFIASVHMLVQTEADTLEFLASFSTLPEAALLWHATGERRSANSIASTTRTPTATMPGCYLYTVGDAVETMVMAALPAVANAFQMAGCSVSTITSLWTRQCFWNYLDWEGVVQYIVLCSCLGGDGDGSGSGGSDGDGGGWVARWCTAVLAHMQPIILEHAMGGKEGVGLMEALTSQPIAGFRPGEWLEFMESL
jgi:hypothetical protein